MANLRHPNQAPKPKYTTLQLYIYWQRGLIDGDWLFNQLLINQLYQEMKVAAVDDLLTADFFELSGVAIDVAAILAHLGLARPSGRAPYQPRPDRSAWSEEAHNG
jgi:hypothetical protein